MIEVEAYRCIAERARGRRIAGVDANDAWFCKGATTPELLVSLLPGSEIIGVRRIGKLLLADLSSGLVLGLRFGMTGRLLVDGSAAIDQLLYSSDRNLDSWDRFGLRFADGGTLALRDPRRLGGVELDPDESRLGPDALSISVPAFRSILTSVAAVKAVLLDQHRIAGIGNLLADEMLWRAGIAPGRAAVSLGPDESAHLRTVMRKTLRVLTKRGGSHTGDLQDHRHPGAHCPADGHELRHGTVGGRSTWWCPKHQR
jgi:formamidopyrimidine-DNA glycosylase